jgi:integrase
LNKHVLTDKNFAGILLARFRAGAAEAWGGRLLEADEAGGGSITPSSLNRLLNDLRAALNRAGQKYRRELPASFAQEVKIGTKRVEVRSQPRRQLLTDEQVRSIVKAAFEVDESGDFGRLTMLLAVTGARHSQAAALNVDDLQASSRRVMMPGSRKGRARKRPPVPTPLSAEVVETLISATAGRDQNEPLLMRWHRRKEGQRTWIRVERRAWGPTYETARYWQAAVERAGLPKGTVMYALRHSSIVRGLRAMLPVRLVAALHDTSVQMIEQHYSAFIVDLTEDLARRATISLEPGNAALTRAAA